MARRRATIACDLPLKRAVDGSDRSKPEGAPARVDVKGTNAEMTCIHDQPGLLAIVVLFLFAAAAGEVRRLDVIFTGFFSGSAGRNTSGAGVRGSLDRLTCAAEALAFEPAT